MGNIRKKIIFQSGFINLLNYNVKAITIKEYLFKRAAKVAAVLFLGFYGKYKFNILIFRKGCRQF